MNNNRPSLVWRLWLLIAQVIAVSAGLLIAWKAFGPEPVAPARTDVVALRALCLAPGCLTYDLERPCVRSVGAYAPFIHVQRSSCSAPGGAQDASLFSVR